VDLTLGLPSTLLLETNWYTCQRVNYSVLIEVEPVQERPRPEIKVKNQENEPAQTQPDLNN